MAYNLHRTQCLSRTKKQLNDMIERGIAHIDAERGQSCWVQSKQFKSMLEAIPYADRSLHELTFMAVVEDDERLWLAWFPKHISKDNNYRPRVDDHVNIDGVQYKIVESRYIERQKHGAFEMEPLI